MPRTLTSDEREFFALVSRATFANPFGDERDELDRRIAGGDPQPEVLLATLLARLTRRLATLDEAGPLDVGDFNGEDRTLIEHAVVFELFHRYADDFDAHIELQQGAGATPRRLPFADAIIGDFARRGFPVERRTRAVELFFQLRRAFHFIETSLVGRSASMRVLRESLWNNVFTHDVARYERLLWDRMEDFSTILLGETGTGKGAAAAAIGRSGFIPFDVDKSAFAESFTESLVPLNLSEYPETLIESELFGHRKGAFTGAVDHHEGAFARVSAHGSIFLDEIGEVSGPVQIKLLRVLQERSYSPVGSHETRRFEGRVIAATHRSLPTLRKEKRFRDDFYYRLCSDVIRVPPLRTRVSEDPRELHDLLQVIVPRLVGEPDAALVEEAAQAIRRGIGPGYHWPGNVRELEQCVRRVLLTQRCAPDRPELGDDPTERLFGAMRTGELDAKAVLAGYCAHLHARHGTYESVARITGLDRRTVKKHVTAWTAPT